MGAKRLDKRRIVASLLIVFMLLLLVIISSVFIDYGYLFGVPTNSVLIALFAADAALLVLFFVVRTVGDSQKQKVDRTRSERARNKTKKRKPLRLKFLDYPIPAIVGVVLFCLPILYALHIAYVSTYPFGYTEQYTLDFSRNISTIMQDGWDISGKLSGPIQGGSAGYSELASPQVLFTIKPKHMASPSKLTVEVEHSSSSSLKVGYLQTSKDYNWSASYSIEERIFQLDMNNAADKSIAIPFGLRMPPITIYAFLDGTHNISFIKKELNWYNGSDEMQLNVITSDNAPLYSQTIADDGITSDNRAETTQPASYQLQVPGPGIYKIVMGGDNDFIIENLSLPTKFMILEGEIYPVQDSAHYLKGYSPTLAEFSVSPNPRIGLRSIHKEGLQTVTLVCGNQNHQTIIETLEQWYFIEANSSEPCILQVPRGDIAISQSGYYAFDSESLGGLYSPEWQNLTFTVPGYVTGSKLGIGVAPAPGGVARISRISVRLEK